ncbi:MAG: peptidase domain-containing ABC transporter [Pseudomonadota bacterium]
MIAMTDIAKGRGRDPETDSVAGVVRSSLWPLAPRLLAMSLFVNLLSFAAPMFVLQVYDRVIPHSGHQTLLALVIGVVALIGFDFVLRQARGRAIQMAALRVDVRLTRALFGRLTGAPLRALERRGDGDWRMVLRDADAVRDQVAGPSVLLAIDLPFVVLFMAAIWLAAPPLGALLTILIPVFIGVALLSSALLGKATETEQQAGLARQALSEELVAGRATVKALGLGAALQSRWEAAQAEAIRASVGRGAIADGLGHLGSSLTMLTTVLLTTVGAVAIIDQQMTIGGLIAANMLAARVVQPMTQLIGLWRGLARYREAAARIDATLALPSSRAAAAVAQERPSGALTLEHVEFGYAEDAEPTLRRFSARFAPGSVTGIVGDNGCGKSTVLKVMQGLYAPDAGRVLLDGADLAQFGQRDLNRWFGYVPQEPFLFAGSIRDNIVGGRDGVTDPEILEAARLAMVDVFVAELPDGYATEVGEGGRRLPPGHRQRIALARALVGNPAVLLLDEPSANLDFNAERGLCERLALLKRDRSVVLVSHSNTLLAACDTVMAMAKGRVAMAGRSEDMLARRAGPPRARERQVERRVDHPVARADGISADAEAAQARRAEGGAR